MLTIEANYKDGKIEFTEQLPPVTPSRVLVTFLENNDIDLAARGINETQADDLRARLKSFAEDWERPEAAIYDEDRAK